MSDLMAARARSVVNTALTLLAIFVIGPLASWPIGTLEGEDGGHHASLLVSDAPVVGVLGLSLLVTAAVLLGVIKARLFGWGRGMFVAGLVLAWGAARSGAMDQVYLVSGGATALLVAESALVGVLVLAVGAAVLIGARSTTPSDNDDEPKPEIPGIRDLRLVTLPGSLLGLAAGVAAMAVLCWVFVQTPMRMQALVGGAFAAVGCGAAATMATMSVQKRMTALTPFLAVLLAGVAAPIVGSIFAGGDIAAAARGSSIVPMATLQPLDWAAAACLGVPVGVGWAASLLEKQLAAADESPRRARTPA